MLATQANPDMIQTLVGESEHDILFRHTVLRVFRCIRQGWNIDAAKRGDVS